MIFSPAASRSIGFFGGERDLADRRARRRGQAVVSTSAFFFALGSKLGSSN